MKVTVTDKEFLPRLQAYGLDNSISFHCHVTLKTMPYLHLYILPQERKRGFLLPLSFSLQ